jgi:hypothetical protein
MRTVGCRTSIERHGVWDEGGASASKDAAATVLAAGLWNSQVSDKDHLMVPEVQDR